MEEQKILIGIGMIRFSFGEFFEDANLHIRHAGVYLGDFPMVIWDDSSPKQCRWSVVVSHWHGSQKGQKKPTTSGFRNFEGSIISTT